MAILFFDKTMREMFPEVCEQLFTQIEVIGIKNFERGIDLLYFHDDNFAWNEPVIARLNSVGDINITKKPLQL